MNNFVVNLSVGYSHIFSSLKPVRVKLRKEPSFLFNEQYISSLKQMLNYSERIFDEQTDVAALKLSFDSWFYRITADGFLEYAYNPDILVSISEASEQLGVSRTMIYKYIDRGLEVVGEKGRQKIPKFMLDAWKNPAVAVQMQWIYQIKREKAKCR
ncbi:helix-turn-helix domain-containing protein [Kyrpidia spormannii]|uniref:helix-turn-helix domain-containing protein n=1 Tax=Kyrpidia spormannii TaxID=2055160 RepID=UPI001056146E|nr:helix-turn-helix domain-containing protein [Kyrpidia spormannii]